MDAQLAFADAKGGMNAADPPHKITVNQVARMVNCRLEDGLPTTRYGTQVLPIAGPAKEFFELGNIQGSIFFNPAKGQGGIVLAESNAQIAVACGGRKFIVTVEGKRLSSKAKLNDITHGLETNSKLHLVWWEAWEDLLLAQDGQSNCFIWDGTDAIFSPGYNTINKPLSGVPNGGTVMAYAHARGVAVVNSRVVLVGDTLHRDDISSSKNLLDFVEQVYWATGQYFLPPSKMGNITAAEILPQRDSEHGHGDLMVHCEDGVFSLDLNVFPRSKWIETPMMKHALTGCGATGPYAVATFDGDQFFRTRKGMQTLRSSAAESSLEGNPNMPLSEPVSCWLNQDYPRWMRFASAVLWDKGERFFVTTYPVVHGRFRWHRGMLVRNTDPSVTAPQPVAVWEGLWTLPPESSGIIQFVGGLFDGDERMFAWTRGADGRNRLVEFTTTLREDVLADGTARAIRASCITRAIDAGVWWLTREFTTGRLFLRNVSGDVQWGVWFRTGESPTWHFWRGGKVSVPQRSDVACDLGGATPRTLPIPLGKLPSECQADSGTKTNESRSIQFLVRWIGSCQFENIKIAHGSKDLASDETTPESADVKFQWADGCRYNDFEYSETDEAIWITENPCL